MATILTKIILNKDDKDIDANITKLLLDLLAKQEAMAKFLSEKYPDFLDSFQKYQLEVLFREASNCLDDMGKGEE